jgi:hypothetical protein
VAVPTYCHLADLAGISQHPGHYSLGAMMVDDIDVIHQDVVTLPRRRSGPVAQPPLYRVPSANKYMGEQVMTRYVSSMLPRHRARMMTSKVSKCSACWN